MRLREYVRNESASQRVLFRVITIPKIVILGIVMFGKNAALLNSSLNTSGQQIHIFTL